MARLRLRLVAWLVGLVGLPACAGPASLRHMAGPTDSRPTPVAAAEVVAIKGSGFAELPRVPGERVARHPVTEAPKVAVTPPPASETATGDTPDATAKVRATPDPPLVAAVRAYLDHKPDLAAEHLKLLDKPNQELMSQLLPPLVRLSQLNLNRGGPLELATLLVQIEQRARDLAPPAPLTVTKALFCSRVFGFGRYEPLPEGVTFRGGDLIDLYVELRNVPSLPVQHPTMGEVFVTDLKKTLRIRDASGAAVELRDGDGNVWEVLKVNDPPYYARSALKDYSTGFRFPVPKKPGQYTLTFEVIDPESGRAAIKPMSFRVGGS